MTLTYEDTSRLLSLLDTANGQDLELTLGKLRLSVQAWPQDSTVSATPLPARRPKAAPRTEPSVAERFAYVVPPTLGFLKLGQVAVGDVVQADSIIGEIESGDQVSAPFTASVGGRVVEIVGTDGEFVEYNQAVMIIERH